MTKLPGKVSVKPPPPRQGLAPPQHPTETASLPWWAFDRPQNRLLKALPGQTWNGWDPGSFLAPLCITGLNPFLPSSSSSLPPSFLFRASGLLCKAGQAESVGGLSSTHVSRSYLYNLPSWWETWAQTVSSYLLCEWWEAWSLSWKRICIFEAHYLESTTEFGSLLWIPANRCWLFRIPKGFFALCLLHWFCIASS